jgi:hypothetical protein
MKRQGLNVRDVSNDIEAGVTKIQELFKGRAHPCPYLMREPHLELEGHAYPEKKSLHHEPETPIKENDRACDALRYALFMNSQGGTGFFPPPTVGLVKPFPGMPGYQQGGLILNETYLLNLSIAL